MLSRIKKFCCYVGAWAFYFIGHGSAKMSSSMDPNVLTTMFYIIYQWAMHVSTLLQDAGRLETPWKRVNENENTMKTTCGIFLISLDGKLLIGHPTGANRADGKWSIPKGLLDDNETEAEAAVRECREETGIVLYKQHITELDYVVYPNGKKQLKPFYVKSPFPACIFAPVCESMVTNVPGKKPFPEIDAFMWVGIDEAKIKLHPTQSACLPHVAHLMS